MDPRDLSPLAPPSERPADRVLGAAIGRLATGAPGRSDTPQPPQALFGELFAAVQTAGIYPDGKTFVDAVPREAPEAILDRYRSERPDSPERLRRFVEAHFALPEDPPPVVAPSKQTTLPAHIDALWSGLSRTTPSAPRWSSLLPLPKPYVVPGGRFREIYYWDSYFTMLGLVESGRGDLVSSMVEDFAHLIDTFGHVPNGTRTYYLSRSQPPFFFAMVGLLAADPAEAFARYLPQLRREYQFWMEGAAALEPGAAHRRVVAMPDGAVLNRYWDDRDTPRDEAYREDTDLARASGRVPSQVFRDLRAAAESGWDFSSRWFADAHTLATIVTTEIVPVDLNSLMFGLEGAILAGCEREGDEAGAAEFRGRAAARRAAIDRYLWDGAGAVYLDYRWTERAPIRRLSAAATYPLCFGCASPEQALGVAAAVGGTLLKTGGLVTTPLATGQQWDAPNGWAPLQWIAVSGFNRYGERRLAESIARRWLQNVGRVYRESGKLVEKYDVLTERGGGGGEYPLQDGFGWTNGVTARLMALYPAAADQPA
ncbi:MAG TPA: alpha,alpha-trehalase TreF [Steroidobacteraceae bacterium]|nr:alpha,alpha-trehalase TreF [Steroidobacteraceae bacterium]